MAGRLPPISFRTNRKYRPSTQAILIVSVVLFILFLWLNFVLAQEIESIGREIQVQTELLHRRQRQKDVLLKGIAEAGSQKNMAERARQAGYRLQVPIFLLVDQPLPQPTFGAEGSGRQLGTQADGAGDVVYSSYSLWDTLVRPFGVPEAAP